jgi:hypothetical protein
MATPLAIPFIAHCLWAIDGVGHPSDMGDREGQWHAFATP